MFVARPYSSGAANAMGMDLATNFNVTSAMTNAQVTGWTPRSGFSSTSIISDKIVADGAGTWTLNAKATMTANWFSSTALQINIVKNSSTVATMSIAFQTTTATLTPTSITLASGDTVWMTVTAAFGASGTMASGSTNTYIYFS